MMRRVWRRFLAYWRLSKMAVCEESRNRGAWDDYHDYPDSTIAYPWHMHAHQCKRCGKSFYI